MNTHDSNASITNTKAGKVTSNEQDWQNHGLVRPLLLNAILSTQQLQKLSNQITSHEHSVARKLVEEGIISASLLANLVSKHYGFPLLDISQFDTTYARNVNAELMRACRGLEALPLARKGDVLSVALADPTCLSTLQQLKFRTKLQIEAVVVEIDKLLTIAEQHQGQNNVDQRLMIETGEDELGLNQDQDDPSIDDAPIVRFVQQMLTEALNRGASDIHFEPYEKQYRVRFRIDGVLQETAQPPLAAKSKIAARVKIMAKMNTTETRIPQDGRIRVKLGSDQRKVDFRVSSLPTLFGEKIVMRLLDQSGTVLQLEHLGVNTKQQQAIEIALRKPHGMILVTGPTGSGKTVSLYTFLSMLNKEDVNISTVEDPAEINMTGINQVNINERIGLTFAKALRSLLRQDPDVIMVGEIRDLETADISIKASQTGHKVLSTLHTNDSVATIIRLRNMGVEPYNMASSLQLIIAQRLVRKLCSCKAPHPDGLKALKDAGFVDELPQEDWTPFVAVGCDACHGTGYLGRTGIYEVMPISEAMQELIICNASALQLERQARLEGVTTMAQSGLDKIRAGATTIEEILAATRVD